MFQQAWESREMSAGTRAGSKSCRNEILPCTQFSSASKTDTKKNELKHFFNHCICDCDFTLDYQPQCTSAVIIHSSLPVSESCNPILFPIFSRLEARQRATVSAVTETIWYTHLVWPFTLNKMWRETGNTGFAVNCKHSRCPSDRTPCLAASICCIYNVLQRQTCGRATRSAKQTLLTCSSLLCGEGWGCRGRSAGLLSDHMSIVAKPFPWGQLGPFSLL